MAPALGAEEGYTVGDGDLLGAAEGCGVGLEVGDVEGAADGDVVGEEVAATIVSPYLFGCADKRAQTCHSHATRRRCRCVA